MDQLLCRKYIPMTLFYPHNEKQISPPSSTTLEKSFSDLLSLYYPYAGRIVDNKVVDCNDKGAILSEARIMSTMSDILKQPFSKVQRTVFQNDLPWSEPRLEHDSLAIARLTHFGCGGKALSLCLTHKLGDSNTLCNFLLHWSALARGISFPPPQLIGATLLPPNDDPFTPYMFEVKNQPHTTRRLHFDGATIDHLVDLIASQSDIKNATKAEIVTSILNSALARAESKMKTSSSPFMIYIPLNFRKLISPNLSNLMGNFLSFLLVHIKDENDLKLPTLISKIRTEKIRHFKKYKRLDKEDIPSAIRAETGSFPTEFADMRLSTSLCDYPLYDIDFGWGKPSKVSFGALPTRNTFGIFDGPNGGVVAGAILDEKIMQEFLRDEQILEYACLQPGY
ncbi:hypothetical protein Leryth_013997 [Lithospermum erythrorhizon]|nr:hypothetical protein Leryth_013997 [Lithospermum erythrorhizon]